MADVSVNSAKKKRKGKVSNKEEKQRPNKTRRIHLTESAEAKAEPHRKFQEERPWRNLKLILSLQNREIDLQKKLELAYSFVNSSVEERDAETSEDYETVKTSRLIVFLNDWVQSLIISTEKKVKTDGSKNQSQVIEACLDYRCWVIFKFCLEESLKWHVSLSFSRNLLRAIGAIASSALSLLINSPMTLKESIFVGEGFELYSGVLDCVSLVFNSLGGLSNENLDLWISAMGSVLELVLKIFSENLDGCNAGAFFLQFTCVVLAPFAKFLRVHPTKKNGFRDFIDKLLESLLILLGVLHSRVHESNSHLMKNLLKMVEEVLCQGLFHPIHIDGFLGLHSIDKYLASNDAKQKDSKTIIKSYHRHLFDKLESIMAAKRISVSSAIGRLFHLLVDRIKKLKGATVEASSELERNLSSHMSNDSFGSGNSPAEKRSLSGNLNAEARKSLFEFFVQVMEPLVVEMKRYGEVQLMEGTTLSDTNCTLKSINSLLACFMHEKLYVRTEDIMEGACFNFMKEVHGAIRLFASNLLQLSNRDIGNRVQKEMFTCLSKELLVAVGCFLDIEYEVAGDDLVSLWLMMLSYLGTGFSFLEASELSLLTSQILDLGCQLIDLYCELRQVNNTIFALCKAVRLIVSIERDAETSCNEFLLCSNSLPREAYGKAVGLLLYSQEFRLSIHNAIRSIPEGQASGCIRQLTMDISESLNWMKEISPVVDGKEFSGKKLKDCSTRIFYLCSELLGRDLSEIYALVLDSLIVTSGNSNLVGLSLEDLMILIRPCLSNLIKLEPDSINEFLISVTGITSENELTGNKIELIKCGCFTQWILVFFFRLYLSCRSLQRQVISLMPPDTSKKMSAAMGDFFTAYCGKDWMNKIDWADEGYFAWIAQPSTSLLDIIQFYSEIFRKDNVRDCYPLIYVLHAMSLQRLVDLNRQIKSLEYVQLNNDYVVQTLVLDDVDLSQFRKKCRKWKKCISVMNQEAAGLVDFMMKYISLVTDDQIIFINSDDVCCSQKSVQELLGSNEWNLGVSAVVEESLPTALWWVLNHNIDIWCPHANSKKLKKFLSLLVSTSLPYVTSSLSGLGMHKIENAACVKTVNVPQISSEALCDSFLYEHKFVRRHLASRFCHILDQQALSLLSDFSISDVDFSSSPNWEKVLTALENTSMDVVGKKHVINDLFPVTKAMSHSFDKLPKASGMERKASQAIRMKFTVCQSLLNLLCWMPKGCMNSKSSSLYATHILNLERVVVGCLLQFDGALSSHDKNEFFRLFVSCRRSLKYIIVEFSEGKTESSKSSFIPLLFKDPQFLLWLFKSVLLVVGSREVVADDYSHEIREMKFSLLDHTSYTFLTLSKCQFIGTSHTRMLSENPSTQQPRSGIAQELTNIKDTDPCLDSSKDLEAWKSVCCVLQCLEEQTQSLLLPLKDALPGTKIGVCAQIINLEKLSSIFSCFSGILWGIACTLNHTDGSSDRSKLSRLNGEIVSKLNLYMNIFADYISSLLKILVVEDKTSPAMSCNAQSFQDLGYGRNSLSSFELFSENRKADNRSINDNRHEGVKSTRTYSASSEMAVVDDRSLVEDGGCPSSVLPESDSVEFQRLNRHLLRDLLKGDHPETAALLRQLFAAASVILRLNQKIRSKPFSSSLVLTFIDISHVLLVGLADMVEIPPKFTFVWLDGVLLYLEELGGLFPLTNHTSTINLYTKLMELHIRAIGKCISLQGKKATLASHEIESSTEVFSDNLGSLEVPLPQEILCLNEFKARLRMSFKVFINKPSDPHLLSAIQAIERALLGVQEGCPMFYEIDTGCIDGGNVSSSVAAGIDCLDLILEHVAGRKQLNVVKKHIQNFIAALFNIIVHLRSPVIFCGKPVSIKGDNLPDSGSVILMCIEVLTRVSGKHALFQMDSSHVTQCIRIPASLFQDISHLRFSETSVSSNSFPFMDDQNCSVASLNSFSVDRKFSIDLYAACCRLLYTVLKHNKSDCERCVAVLEESVRLLLQILETVDSDLVAGKGYFSWKVQEGIKCACSLRRIYEELRQQKDVYGQHCFKFLANYIWIYSGFGPRKTGIRREIDEALKPGVYALIDACSADDLQYLHTVFGEGPCRNTLATLQHDYKLNFRYEGKV